MKGKIKKYVALVLSVQQLLCGCSATELEDRCFPMMAVVDEKDGQISFGYGFPKLSQKDNTDLEEARVNIAPVTGKTMESCVQTYDSRLEKLADCNHMKVLVFGENLMEDTGRYADVLSYLKQTGLFPRNIYVCVAEDPLALFETEEDLPQDLGSYLEPDDSQLSLVAHMEIAMVRSAYRGNGLQKKLMEAAEEQLRSAGFRWLMGTAHPDNVYSVHNFKQLGYKLVTKALKYGGLPRYIFCKKI